MSNDGGPAFPLYCVPGDEKNASGMTLRDYFAAKAMQGWIATLGECLDSYDGYPEAFAQHQVEVAKTCYGYADAMLKARQS